MAQAVMENESNNIANAMTQGYTKKIVTPLAQVLNGQGAGVAASIPQRQVNESFLIDERVKLSSSSYHQKKSEAFHLLQMGMGQPGQKNSLSEMIKDFSNKCESLTLESTSTLKRKEVLETLQTVTEKLTTLTGNIQKERMKSDKAIKSAIDEVNTKVLEIHEYNQQILANTRAGLATGDLEDQRDNALRTIAKHVDLQITKTDNGEIFLQTTRGVSLLSSAINTLNFSTTTTIDATNQYDPDPALSGVNHITYSDSGGNLVNVTDLFTSGDIAAHVEIRDRDLTNLQAQLDQLATTLRDKVNEAHNLGSGYPPATSLTGTRSFSDPATELFQGAGTLRLAVVNKTTGQFETAPYDLDLGALGPVTINNLAANIDGNLAGANATVTAEGFLSLTTANPDHGLALIPVGGNATENTTGLGFSHYFGLNDLLLSPGHVYDPATLVSGLSSQLSIREDLKTTDSLLSRGRLNDALPTPNVGDHALRNGDNRAIVSLVDFLETPQFFPNTGGLGEKQLTLTDYSSEIISEAARRAKNAQASFERESRELSNIKDAQGQIGGVNMQESLLNLMDYQKIYMGSSKVISVEKENFKHLMSI